MKATEADKKDLIKKVAALVKKKFDGDYFKAFNHYDTDKKDGKLNKSELEELLADADIGWRATRGFWAEGIIKQLDTDKDGAISWVEFEYSLK